ncbi:hypothetical protein PALB_9310 [Pseudoalteromonas luteoviolacea B = ATCC 29581]|nr:hypothetical protein PALB_9310 [Pseudoalteromonas luteoviolacea B = ATCC 29581]
MAFSQLLIRYRGVHSGVWAFFWGSVMMLLAQAPLVIALIGTANA